MSCLEGYLFSPGPEGDSGQSYQVSVPEVSFLQEPRWGWEPTGGREDSRSMFAVVAAEVVARRETSPLQWMSQLHRFRLGRRKEGQKTWEGEGRRGDQIMTGRRGRLVGGVTEDQVKRKKCHEENRLSDQECGRHRMSQTLTLTKLGKH